MAGGPPPRNSSLTIAPRNEFINLALPAMSSSGGPPPRKRIF